MRMPDIPHMILGSTPPFRLCAIGGTTWFESYKFACNQDFRLSLIFPSLTIYPIFKGPTWSNSWAIHSSCLHCGIWLELAPGSPMFQLIGNNTPILTALFQLIGNNTLIFQIYWQTLETKEIREGLLEVLCLTNVIKPIPSGKPRWFDWLPWILQSSHKSSSLYPMDNLLSFFKTHVCVFNAAMKLFLEAKHGPIGTPFYHVH